MPHPFAKDAISAVHEEFYSESYDEARQVFADGERLLNSEGANPVVLELSSEEKTLMGLTEFSVAYRIRVLGRGDSTVDDLCTGDKEWTISFDGGSTTVPYALNSAIAPDTSMQNWVFVLYRTNTVG